MGALGGNCNRFVSPDCSSIIAIGFIQNKEVTTIKHKSENKKWLSHEFVYYNQFYKTY